MTTFRAIRRVLWITLGLNLVATLAKLVVGYLTGSLSLIADGFDSVFDAASNVIGLVGVYMAARPADPEHPYGHRKAETMTALVISSLLFLTTWELVKSALERLRDPTLIQTEVNAWSFAALLVSIVVHAIVVSYELRAGRRLRSDVLVADALHTRADIFVSLAVIGGLVAVRLGFPLADPIIALVVALFIAKIGLDIIRESAPTLMDGVALPPDEVERIALSVPGVLSCHRVRSRGHEQAIYADLHVHMSPAMSVEQSHAIVHEIRHRLHEYRPDLQDVVIHVEPGGSLSSQAGLEGIATRLRRLAAGLGLEIHDVWAHEIDGAYCVEAHIETNGALSLQQAHKLASSLEARASIEIANLAEMTTHIEPRGQQIDVSGPGVPEAQVAQAVRDVVESTGSIQGCHQVHVYRGQRGWVVSLHCHLPGKLSLVEAHRVSTLLEERLREGIASMERVVIHTEPWEA